jgi:hypothetical protein
MTAPSDTRFGDDYSLPHAIDSLLPRRSRPPSLTWWWWRISRTAAPLIWHRRVVMLVVVGQRR